MSRKIESASGNALALLAALVLGCWISVPGAALAATSGVLCETASSATDTDQDGFNDYDECNGFYTTNNKWVYGFKELQLPAGELRMDPQIKDVFVNLVKANPSLLPTGTNNELMSFYATGLGLTVHIIDNTYYTGDRQLTATQKAIRIGESTLNDAQTILGDVWHGTPNYRDGATIYTKRIVNVVNTTCKNSNADCRTSTGITGLDNVAWHYMKNVLAHEAGHASNLTPVYSSRNEWHYAQGAGTVMEKSIRSVSKSAPYVFYISTVYDPQDKAAPSPVFAGGANPTTTVNNFVP